MEIFKDNLINWLILLGLIVYLWFKFMPGIFAARRQQIESAIAEAARAKQEGADFLAAQKQRIANAEEEAKRIVVEAQQVAEKLKQDIAEQTKKDSADLEQKLEQQISTHRQMVITELRSQAAVAAVRLAEASLPGAITDNVKKGLQERFVTQLDQIGANK